MHAANKTVGIKIEVRTGCHINDHAQRPPPETPGRLQRSLTNFLNRPTA
jgi:hypothetical protein